jgi:cytochrome c oxidase subunit 4
MASQQGALTSSGEHERAHAHPGEMVYIRIAVILSVITAVEVLIYYLESFEGILVPALILLSAAKFFIVIEYFMHLKFDDRKLSGIFLFGLGLALATFVALCLIVHFDKAVTFFGGK